MTETQERGDAFLEKMRLFHRAHATNDLPTALIYAREAMHLAPCDGEASIWSARINHLELNCSRGLRKIGRIVGIRTKDKQKSTEHSEQ